MTISINSMIEINSRLWGQKESIGGYSLEILLIYLLMSRVVFASTNSFVAFASLMKVGLKISVVNHEINKIYSQILKE